jgi:hypothetical protein
MAIYTLKSDGFAGTVAGSHFAEISVLKFEVQEGHQNPMHSRG